MYYLGVDCGGTHMRVGIVDENGEILGQEYGSSPLKHSPSQFAAFVKSQAEKIASEKQINLAEIQSVGVGTPGPLDLEHGSILKSSNLGNTEPLIIRSQFEEAFQKPVFLGHDTAVALRGETWKGAAQGLQHVVMLTLGTGVGGASMTHGQIDEGKSGKAGEMGHIFLQVPDLLDLSANKESPTCGLGHRGCFEALVKSTQDVEKIGYYLGFELANVVDIFNPEMIIIGGGMIKHGDFLPKAIEVMKEKGMFPAIDEVKVEYCKLGEFSGVIGAAKLAMDSMKSSE